MFIYFIYLIFIIFPCFSSNKIDNINKNIFLKKIWKKDIGNIDNINYKNLYYKNKNLIFFNKKGKIYLLNITNGKFKYKFNLYELDKLNINKENFIYKYISFYKDNIYFFTNKSYLYSFNINSKQINWKKKVLGKPINFPIIKKNNIIIHTSNGLVYLFDIKGNIKWITRLNDNKYFYLEKNLSDPILKLDSVLVIDDLGFLNLLSIDNGEILWKKKVFNKNNFNSNPITFKNNIYINKYNDYIIDIDLFFGKNLWKKNIYFNKNIIFFKKKIFLIDIYNNIFCLNYKNGKTYWIQNILKNKKILLQFIYKNHLIVVDELNNFYFINIDNGKFIFKQKINNLNKLNKIVVINNILLIINNKKYIYAFI